MKLPPPDPIDKLAAQALADPDRFLWRIDPRCHTRILATLWGSPSPDDPLVMTARSYKVAMVAVLEHNERVNNRRSRVASA